LEVASERLLAAWFKFKIPSACDQNRLFFFLKKPKSSNARPNNTGLHNIAVSWHILLLIHII
jgi:hypothetical protein